MKLFKNINYMEDVKKIAELDLPWEKMKGKSVMISGATGLIGSFLIDVIMQKNRYDDLQCTVYALGRSEERAKKRFSYCFDDDTFYFIPYDINKPLIREDIGTVEYILHLASNTHPVAYATDPVGTITTNIIGTKNMLDFAVGHNAVRCAFVSSCEIYGENRGDVDKFDEGYCGYIDCNTVRAGYPESKRCGEALCQAYICQKGLDIVIPRLTRSYGPTLLSTDTKALSQFLRNGLAGEDIVLKSAGTQYYSYTYVADAVSGLLTVLLKGVCGEAYNVSNPESDIMLKDLASIIAAYVGKRVIFDVPNATEAKGFSKATKSILENRKLLEIGWKPLFSIEAGIKRTIDMLHEK